MDISDTLNSGDPQIHQTGVIQERKPVDRDGHVAISWMFIVPNRLCLCHIPASFTASQAGRAQWCEVVESEPMGGSVASCWSDL